jgi:hypothetical protein
MASAEDNIHYKRATSEKSVGEAAIICQRVEDNAFHFCPATRVLAAR